MKRILNILLVVCLLFAMVLPAAATEFVPSISVKGAPELVPVGEEDGEPIYGYVLDKDGNVIYTVRAGDIWITPISEVDTSEYISEAAAKLLKETYAELLANPDTFKGKVVRELVDISVSTRLAAALEGEGTTLELKFDIGLDDDMPIWIQALIDDCWNEIVKTANNGDGTVSGTFEAFCPVVFLVPGTDDGGCCCCCCFWLYLLLITICLILILIIILWYRRKKAEEEQTQEEEQNQEQTQQDPNN